MLFIFGNSHNFIKRYIKFSMGWMKNEHAICKILDWTKWRRKHPISYNVITSHTHTTLRAFKWIENIDNNIWKNIQFNHLNWWSELTNITTHLSKEKKMQHSIQRFSRIWCSLVTIAFIIHRGQFRCHLRAN